LINAKAKGIHIGRKKTRDSDLLRKLRASGMTYRECARVGKCSTGAVSAEMKAMKIEALAIANKKALEDLLMPKLELENSSDTSLASTGIRYQGQVFNFENQDTNMELER